MHQVDASFYTICMSIYIYINYVLYILLLLDLVSGTLSVLKPGRWAAGVAFASPSAYAGGGEKRGYHV